MHAVSCRSYEHEYDETISAGAGIPAQNGNITKGRCFMQIPLLTDVLMIILEVPDFGTNEFYNV